MSRKILIAEDDKDILEILTLYLENDGFEVKKAKNGKEAMKILEKEKIHLIIADIMMPIMNGHELIKMFQSLYYLQKIWKRIKYWGLILEQMHMLQNHLNH